ncbi:cobalt/nickel transport system permease protein [Psychrobacillus sp. OK028]|uniref:cobalt ECF transporter T component CbiQ n=1 Tax=Psychrobacillus sp. OK028 TaxID=1884359 RepID=UPI00087EA433|nr:cobalt ECF transporter T component CbiQ [Psychrobacillus sp. OK028]SDM90701.1 cobalt/nickel transport system permease protein [Psychrobacillus sp. OK028]
MSNIKSSLYNLRVLDDLARKETSIHLVHPLTKLLTTVVFLTVVLSFGRYEIVGLLPFFFYPIVIITVAEIPLGPILKRVLLAMPFIIGIGIFNPVFDQQTMSAFGLIFSKGWVTFLSILIKSCVCVGASLLLIATTGMDSLAAALRMLKVPKIFVLQLLLTYRYIYVLIEEISHMMLAYSLRAPRQRGIHPRVWGSFVGQLILRTFDRAQRIYDSMALRNFNGEYHTGKIDKNCWKDMVYLFGWCLFFIIARTNNLPMLIGSFITKVVN